MPSRFARCIGVLAAAGALAAQEHAAKWRPVPGLAAAQPLRVPLPRPRSPDTGAGAVFAARGRDHSVLWIQDDKLQEAPLRLSAVGSAPIDIDFGNKPPVSLQLGDFDGDGRDEVIVRSLARGILVVHLDEPDRVIPDSRPSRGLNTDGPWFSGRAFDWFGDGRAAPLFIEGSRVLARRDPFTKTETVVLVDLGAANVPAGTTIAGTAGDFDLDGMPDLVLALPERGLVWCRHEGTRTAPRFSEPIPLWPAEPGVLVTSVQMFPIDDDPWPDLVLGTVERAREGTGDFAVRVPRVPTAAEAAKLRELEAQVAPQTAPRLPTNLLPRESGSDPFATLLAAKRRADRIDELRWREQPMVARAPLVHYRSLRR
jgi:hypothetical protein